MKKKHRKKQDLRTKPSATPAVPLTVAIDWNEVILVCTRCAGKLDGRMEEKGRTMVRAELRTALKERGGKREARVMETGCFGICPKGGQVIATASGLRRGKLHVFDGDDDGATILESLMPLAPPVVG